MEKSEASLLSRIPDSVKLAVIRWWFAGAMYFMFGWGLLGEFDPLDQIFFIGVAIGVAHIFVLHPLVYSMFDIERKGKMLNKKYYERSILEGVLVKIGEIFKCIICSAVVGLVIYNYLNVFLIWLLNLNDDYILGVEPILFGLFFTGVYYLINIIVNLLGDLINKIKEKRSVE